MSRLLFYAGTVFCLFAGLTSAAEALREFQGGAISFAALTGSGRSAVGAQWAVLVALIAGLTAATLFLRMAALLAARNLFGSFLALFAVTGSQIALAWLLMLQWRIVVLLRASTIPGESLRTLSEMHAAAYMVYGTFLALSLVALRPYFLIQASRFLSALVLFPLPLVTLLIVQDLFAGHSAAPLPASSPGSVVLFGVLSVLFISIAVHCIRHRYLFIETTNLRELLDTRPVRVAFDS